MPPARVALFVTCLVDLLYPEVGEASAALLRRVGADVAFPAGQTCCGQPPYNSGFVDDARRVARTTLRAFDGFDAVVSPSGSCTAMLRVSYPRLFAGEPEERRARDLSGRTFELTEYLVDRLSVDRIEGRWEGQVTYHDACHGLRELGLRGQGRQLLSGIDGLELVEMARPDACCGFGGTFSVRLPEVAVAMADDKVAQVAATGAATVVAGDAGCLMHLSGRLTRSGADARALHIASLLASAGGLEPAAT
jgi:L-lactate dehydrogenase complex protein LldE